MTFTYKLARRLAHSRIGLATSVALAAAACSAGEPTSPTTSGTTDLLAAVKIAPKKATIETEQAIRFYGTGVNAAGDSMATSIEWTVTGGDITADGVFSASTTGSFRVIGKARGHNKSDTSTVVVVPPQPTLTAIAVTPASATVNEGKTVSFSATGRLSDGSTAPIGVVWSATGGAIDAGGTYTAGMTPGAYHVVAANTSGTVADTVPVVLSAPQLAQIVLLPATVTLAPGATQQFTAYGRTSTGDSIASPVSFTATGGTASAGGLYTAGQTTGTFRVIATSTTTNLADTAAVTIQPASLAQLILVPALATVATGGTVQFQVYGRTAAGDSITAQATYSATGGTLNSTGLYTAGSTAGTFRVVATGTTANLADTSAVTITASPPPGQEVACLNRPGAKTTISGLQTQRYDNRSIPNGAILDATAASWSSTIPYPVVLKGGDKWCWSGARIVGLWSDTTSWSTLHGPEGMEIQDGGDSSLVERVSIEEYGHAISWHTNPHWTLRHSHFKHIHDDCVENDWMQSALVDDVLFEGCYDGFSARPDADNLYGVVNGHGNVWTIQNSLIWMEPMPDVYAGPSPSTSNIFKWDDSQYDSSPDLVLRNNIFRVDVKPGDGNACLVPKANTNHLIQSSGNIIVWTGGGSYPCLPIPSGFTLTTDITVWQNAVTAWKAAHPGL